MNIYQVTSSYRTRLIISAYKKWLKPGERIIDIGCGTGVVTKILQEYFSANIIGCDIKNYLIYKIPFLKIKDNKIPSKNKYYDVATLNDVLHHIKKEFQIEVIKEAARVSKMMLIFEFEPTIVGKLADIILNKLHYGDLN